MATDHDDPARASRRQMRQGDRSRISLLQIFRTAHRERDSRVDLAATETGETAITSRSKMRRDGVDESTLKSHVQADLGALMNTIQLGAIIDLSDAPHVERSVLNYGFRDLSDVTARELNSTDVVASIRRSLLNHEPRIVPETLEVRVADGSGGTQHRLEISVTAELMADPVDVPIDFEAEVDLGAGKLRMRSLRVSS
jgi:type VI secretion system lysozyme-like protein